MKEKCVTLLSGGMDSATLMYSLLEKYDVWPITIVYGQRHQKEVTAARNLCEAVSKEMVQRWKYVDLSVLRNLLPSTLTGNGDIPEGLYDAPSMSQTVVPGRNLILLAVAGGYANGIGARFLAYGAHSGDHFIYKDCRPEFVEAAGLALERGYGVELIAPFSEMDKGDIAILGRKLNVPYKLSWTCVLPTTLIMTHRRGWLLAEEVVIGDEVLTHLNRWRKVTQVFCNDYEGDLCYLKSYGLPFELGITPEHLMYTINNSWQESKHFSSESSECVKSRVPQYYLPVGVKTMDERFAILLGYFAAEGSYTSGNYGVCFSFKDTETDYINEVVKCGESLWGLEAHLSHHTTFCEMNVSFYNLSLVEKLQEFLGDGDTNQRHWSWIMDYEPRILALFVERLFRGDGFEDKSKAQIGISTTNFELMTVFFEAHKILGHVPSMMYKSPKSSNGVLSQWRINIQSKQLKTGIITRKFQDKESRNLCDPTKSKYIGKVYNFEVDEDNSYVADGFKVHNCYTGQERPCGRCGACTERTSAFLKAGTTDPALTLEEWKKAVEYLNSVKW